MKSEELRVGNKLFNGTVCQINKGEFKFFDDYSFWSSKDFPAENILPIPLTPEILEQCGFVKDGFKAYNLNISPFPDGIRLLCFSGDYLYIKEGDKAIHPAKLDVVCLWNKDLMKEFYLHQLQNLYFAPTNRELKLNGASPLKPNT